MEDSLYPLPSWIPKDRALWPQSDDDGVPTKTSVDQRETEAIVKRTFNTASWASPANTINPSYAIFHIYLICLSLLPTDECRAVLEEISALVEAVDVRSSDSQKLNASVALKREKHTAWLTSCIKSLSVSYQSLDASQPWIVFWLTHSLDLLGTLGDVGEGTLLALVTRLALCQSPSGGFGGGQYQLAHLAPTYAAVAALLTIAAHLPETHRRRAYDAIDKPNLVEFLRSLKQPNGSFIMHINGESDVRASYCAMAVSSMLNLFEIAPELSENVVDYIVKCQNSSIEGVPGGEEGNEGHGGYAYCALSAAVILKEAYRLDIDSLEKWAVSRQVRLEGGFSGRSNKLVDCCYSFWLGAMFPLMDSARSQNPSRTSSSSNSFSDDPDGPLMFDQRALQAYILACCQYSNGGLFDKPGKGRDLYHTCYGLSGLSIAQTGGIVIGDQTNLIERTDPEYNISITARKLSEDCFYKT